MAEAMIPRQTNRFYCHCCEREIHPTLPELVCPNCESDFIEEVTANSRILQTIYERQLYDQLLVLLEPGLLSSELSSNSVSDSEDSEEEQESAVQAAPSPPSHVTSEGDEQDSGPEQPRSLLPGFLQRFWASLFPSNRLSSQQQHSNLGASERDLANLHPVYREILQQLMDLGPRPAKQKDISSLTIVEVSQEQADRRLECLICMEEYTLRERVTKLPCLHYFHNACVVRWLKLHDSCPVCRRGLSGSNNSPGTEL